MIPIVLSTSFVGALYRDEDFKKADSQSDVQISLLGSVAQLTELEKDFSICLEPLHLLLLINDI